MYPTPENETAVMSVPPAVKILTYVTYYIAYNLLSTLCFCVLLSLICSDCS